MEGKACGESKEVNIVDDKEKEISKKVEERKKTSLQFHLKAE